jgi:pyruvate kinase
MARHALKDIGDELESIRTDMLDVEHRFEPMWNRLPEEHRASARNLLDYLAFRRHDLRALQGDLVALGLSSLGRSESHVLASVEAVRDVVRRLSLADAGVAAPRIGDGRRLLDSRTRALFGAPPPGRDVRIMVTMPAEAADDPGLVHGLVTAGMDCMRVNAAHDDAARWERMVGHLRSANADTGRACRVAIDLAGPKLRTTAVEPGPPVIRWRPRRDAYGRVTAAARIWLTAREHPRRAPDAGVTTLPVPGAWLAGLDVGARVTFFDARDAKRRLTITGRADGGVWASSDQTAYVMPGTSLRATSPSGRHERTTVGDLPRLQQTIVLKPGDTLLLLRHVHSGRPALVDAGGQTIAPAVIGLTLPEVFDDVQTAEPIWFDDGRIGGTIQSASPDQIVVAVTHARADGSRLGGDKGVNLPGSTLRLPALTAKDLDDLRFIAAHADIVGYSFVRTAQDVRELQARLADLGRADLGLILKIETRRAFEQLPALLLAAMHSPAAGVMIARGDLAVECGYERLAEVQEEILWMAEASHTPVVWATQVLESLAKEGIPSRAEITDAAMGERAECVMLNKGPFILGAVRALDSILTRMQAHQRKKSAMLRQLGVADSFFRDFLP